MERELKRAFDSVHATEEMKDAARSVLRAAEKQRTPRRAALWAAAVAAAVLMLFGLGFYRDYRTPVAYVSIDVNPSIELALNRYDRILSVRAYNDDGARVLANVALTGRRYTEAIDLLVDSDDMAPYLTADAALTFTVAAEDSAREEALIAGVSRCRGYVDHSGDCRGASVDYVEEAHGYGLSFGKYQAYLELAEYDDTVTPEDCCEMTMAEIRDRTAACRHAEAGEHHGNGYGGGNGYGAGNGSSPESSAESESESHEGSGHAGNGSGNGNGNGGGNGNGNGHGQHHGGEHK